MSQHSPSRAAVTAAIAALTWTSLGQPDKGTEQHDQLTAAVAMMLERGDDVSSASLAECLVGIADWTRSDAQRRTCRDLVSRLA